MAPESVWRPRNVVCSGEDERTLDRRPLNLRFTGTWRGARWRLEASTGPTCCARQEDGQPHSSSAAQLSGDRGGLQGSPQPRRGGTNSQVHAGGVPKLRRSTDHLIRKNLSKPGCKRPATCPPLTFEQPYKTPSASSLPPPSAQLQRNQVLEERREGKISPNHTHTHTHTHTHPPQRTEEENTLWTKFEIKLFLNEWA